MNEHEWVLEEGVNAGRCAHDPLSDEERNSHGCQRSLLHTRLSHKLYWTLDSSIHLSTTETSGIYYRIYITIHVEICTAPHSVDVMVPYMDKETPLSAHQMHLHQSHIWSITIMVIVLLMCDWWKWVLVGQK